MVRSSHGCVGWGSMLECLPFRIQVVIEKPPWTLKDLVHILDKYVKSPSSLNVSVTVHLPSHCRHWVAVFGLVLERTLKDTITGLCRYVTNRSSKFISVQ